MTAQSVSAVPYAAPKDNLLRWALRANHTFSGLSGIACILAAEPLAALIGVSSPWILVGLGVGLILYAAELFWTATRSPIPRRLALTFVLMDGIWVVASIILLLTNVVPLTVAGKWLIAIVADVVGVFAILQFVGVRRLSKQSN